MGEATHATAFKRRSPAANFTCIDRSDASLQRARAAVGDAGQFDRGIAALERTTAPDGMFGYTVFKAVSVRRAALAGR